MSSAPRLIGNPIPSLEIPLSYLCSLTRGIMREPVKDPHGHLFERIAIEEWLKTHRSCPHSHKSFHAADLTPNRDLQYSIEAMKVQEVLDDGQELPPGSIPYPTGKQNDDLAKTYLKSAQELEAKDQFLDAERMYITALQYTCKSEDYAHLPRLFERKKESKRAALAYTYLATLQIQEGKLQEGVNSVKKCLQLAFSPAIKYQCAQFLKGKGLKQEASCLFLELAMQARYNNEAIHALSICQQALECFRGNVEIWKMLACLQEDSLDANKLLLEGAKEPLLSLKDRKSLCQWVLLKEPEHVQASLLLLSLKVSKLQMQKKELEQKYKTTAGQEEIRTALLTEKIERLVDTLWGARHLEAALQLARIGAPAIPFLISALKTSRGRGTGGVFFTQQPVYSTKVDGNILFSGIGSILYTLEQMMRNAAALPALKSALLALINELQSGRLKLQGDAGAQNPRASVLNLGVKLGLLTSGQAFPKEKIRESPWF